MQTLQDIATRNHLSPQQVYLAMKPAKEVSQKIKMPQSPPPGTGNRSLADICQEYNLNIPLIINGLSEENIKAAADMTIREIAQNNSRSPIDIYETIRELVD